MCKLQFFGQITERRIRIHEGVVGEPRAEAKTDDEAVQLRDRIQLALRIHDSFKYAALFIGQRIFDLRQEIRDKGSQLIRAAAGFDCPRL